VTIVPAPWPVPLNPVHLEGMIIRLEPLSVRHEPELFEISRDPRIWRYLTSHADTQDAFRGYINTALNDYRSGSALPLVIRSSRDGRAIGMTRLKQLSRDHRKALIGSWVVPSAWGSGANAESKLLLLQHAFEELQCLRIEFHADARNIRSVAALMRMGAVKEGVLRSDAFANDGSRRDSVIFSVLAAEWPTLREILQARLTVQAGATAPG
jgi:RimJ/RimL family protein N-acetyltransferase